MFFDVISNLEKALAHWENIKNRNTFFLLVKSITPGFKLSFKGSYYKVEIELFHSF